MRELRHFGLYALAGSDYTHFAVDVGGGAFNFVNDS